MAEFKITETGIKDLIIIEPQVFGDSRGFFIESYNKRDFEKLGLDYDFIQDNHSKSTKGVLRGLHFQTQCGQDKLIRALRGSVYDIAVDLRNGSDTFGKWFGLILSAEDKRMLMVPKGFAHGFLTLEDETEFQYKVTDYYAPEFDSGLIWNDETLKIDWPLEKYGINVKDLKLSEKDKKLQTFQEYTKAN